MKHFTRCRAPRSRRGNLLIATLGLVFALGGVVATYSHITSAGTRLRVRAYEDQQALYAAEAALNESFVLMRSGQSGSIGSEKAPVKILGGSCFVEEADLGGNLVSLLSCATAESSSSRVEVIVRRTNEGSLLDYALAGKHIVRLASNVLVDSFDSSAGDYDDQVDGGHAKESGTIASNDSAVVSSNTVVYGGLHYGTDPGDFPLIAANAKVTGAVTTVPQTMVFPSIEVPAVPVDSGDLELENQTYVVGPGDHLFDEVEVDKKSTLRIEGPARVVMTSFLLNQNCTFEIDATAGSVELYVLEDFELQSNSDMVADAKQARQIQLNLLADHDSEWDGSPTIEFNSNASFTGVIYAPDAQVTIDSNFEVFGAIAAEWIELSSNTQLHYDEALSTVDGDETTSLEVVAWRPVSDSQAARLASERAQHNEESQGEGQ